MKSRLLFLASFAFLFACQKQSKVAPGMEVSIHYKLTVDEAVLDSSEGKEPLRFIHGSGQIIPGLEQALLDMKVGEKKQVTLSPEQGYGPINPQAQQRIPLSAMGGGKNLKVGMTVNGQGKDGRPLQAKVLEIGKKDALLDFNHPLAGKTLKFDVDVVAVAAAPKQEAPMAPPVSAQ